jgi:hypothetical protein
MVVSFHDEQILGEGECYGAGAYGEGSDAIYIWNDETLSENDYLQRKEAVFSGDIHGLWEENEYSYKEIMEYLDGY